MPQLNIDCEGPITQNDNAFELCEALVPRGAEFFARVSKYDDYLADVEKRADYKAGDTLKLVLPFLRACGTDSRTMEEFSERTLVLLPGADRMLNEVASLMPTYIISTSYKPYLDALCRVTGFPEEQVYCTQLDIDRYELSGAEKERLLSLASEIADQPLLTWPDEARDLADLDPANQDLVRRLDEIFWGEIPRMAAGAMLTDVCPVGGTEKARAVVDSLQRTGLSLGEVFYVGDSITDAPAMELVAQNGGVALAFNGNRYAIKASAYACICGHTGIIAALARLLHGAGMAAMAALLDRTPGVLEGEGLLAALSASGVDESLLAPLRVLPEAEAPRLFDIGRADTARLIRESEKARKGVRGLRVGELG